MVILVLGIQSPEFRRISQCDHHSSCCCSCSWSNLFKKLYSIWQQCFGSRALSFKQPLLSLGVEFCLSVCPDFGG